MATLQSPSELLQSAFRNRMIAFNDREIAAIVDEVTADGQRNARWIIDHLQEDTLLTVDELNLLILLERREILDNFQESELSTTRIVSDIEIRSAIRTLEVETADLQKDILILKSQHAAADRLLAKKLNAQNNERGVLDHLAKGHAKEFQQLHLKIEDLKRDMNTKLSNKKEQVIQENRNSVLSAMTVLKEHDRILSKTESVIAEQASQATFGTLQTRVNKLASLLSSLTSECIHSHLQRTYLETSSGKTGVLKKAAEVDESEISLIESDLESLFPEIEILAQVAANQQYQAPIEYELDKDCSNSNSKLEETLDLVRRLINEYKESTVNFTNNLLYQQSSLMALMEWSQRYSGDPELSPQDSALPNASRRKSLGQSDREDVSILQPSDMEALLSLLRRIGVQTKQNFVKSDEDVVLANLSEKRNRTQDTLRHLYKAKQSPLAADLMLTDKANQILQNNLTADSDYGLSLTNPTEGRLIGSLANKIQSIQKFIERQELQKEDMNDRSREKFVNRWL